MVAVVVIGVVLGSLAVFATTLGGPAVRQTAAQGLEAGDGWQRTAQLAGPPIRSPRP